MAAGNPIPAEQDLPADEIAYLDCSNPGLKTAAELFTKFRNLVAGGDYAPHTRGNDLGYVGNVATVAFGGPPRKVLEQPGLTGARVRGTAEHRQGTAAPPIDSSGGFGSGGRLESSSPELDEVPKPS